MQFTKDFVSRVKDLYPDSAEMHRLAEEGNAFIGRYLDDSSSVNISPDTILNTSYEELIKRAMILKQKQKLYADFIEGKCYSAEDMRKTQCPALYLQNICSRNRYEVTDKICVGVGYVGYYPHCKNWACKEKCWSKYDEVI